MQPGPSFEKRLLTLLPHLNERQKRLAAALEAKTFGHGGVSQVSRVTGLSRVTLHKAIRELKKPSLGLRVRMSGGGRKREADRQPGLTRALSRLVESATRGDPMSSLLWTCKSTRELAGTLEREGYAISHPTVATLLKEMGYSLQANQKTLEGAGHPDRDRQFHYLNDCVGRCLKGGSPVISVDTKKKELIGRYHNKGETWRPKGEPEKVMVHDFIDPEIPKAIPYGVYDVGKNQGWVNVGCDHDTATFAMESIRRWWQKMGQPVYPEARRQRPEDC